MRILVEPSDYILRNAGDMAMLEVAVSRLGKLWPAARIQVLSDVPAELPRYAANAVALDAKGRRLWYSRGWLLGRFTAQLPQPLQRKLYDFERWLQRNRPPMAILLLKARLRRLGRQDQLADLDQFLEAITEADLVLANGMGGIADVFPEYATELLDTLRLAQQNGAVTAMMGQGMGPLENSELRKLALAVLPNVQLIALREQRAGKPLLASLGVANERIMVTGDDAIELAFSAAAEATGNCLGINIRAADYAGVDKTHVNAISHVFKSMAAELAVPLLPVPISRVPGEVDGASILHLWQDQEKLDASTISAAILALDTPLKVIHQIQRCRIVVVGSYHAAVFALAQGIPAVGMANSPYYRDKFLGLADQFGAGCSVVMLDDADFAEKLKGSIREAWANALQLRPALLAAAKQQVMQSQHAYQSLYDIVEQGRIQHG